MYKANDLKELLAKYDDKYELEIRFKPYYKLEPLVVKAKLDKISKPKITEITTIYYRDNYRSVNGVKQQKKPISTYYADNDGYRVALSQETNVSSISTDEETSRKKTRYTYKDKLGHYDLSISDNMSDLEYEFNVKPTVKQIESKIEEGFRLINGKGIMYNKDTFTRVIDDYNRILSGRKGNNMDYDAIVKVVNLKYHHLEDLIGNYVCAVKVDGHRYIMYCNGKSTFLLYPNYRVKLIEIANRDSFMLDGELVDNTYYISDVMMYKDKVVTNKNLLERRKYFDDYDSTIGDIRVISKPYYVVDDFFAINKKVVSSIDKSDGLVYTPINSEYLVTRVGKNTKGLLYKWKREEHLTIDLRYKGGELYTSNGTNIKDITGKADITFDEIDEGAIGEYRYKDNKFHLVKLRNKKVEPNSDYVARDVWNDIVKPLDYKSIIGEGNKMLFRYHNSVKIDLINRSSKSIREDIICLDIGSGRLGDLHKWKNYKTIICVEPNEDNINEGLKRLGKDDRITILKTGGENTKSIVDQVRKITRGKMCNVISLMLSLTFFDLQDGKIFDTIEQCAADNCNLIFFTIDGESFKYTFKKDIKFNGITIQPQDDVSVKINIEDSIVKDQVEYYVDTGLFIQEMCKRGFDMEYYNIAKEGFMSKNELEFSKLFISVIMNKNNNVTPNKMKKNVGKVEHSLFEVVDDVHVDKHQYLFRSGELKSSIYNDSGMVRIITSSVDNLISCLLNTNNLQFQEMVNKRKDLVRMCKKDLARVLLYQNDKNEYNYTGNMAYKFLEDRTFTIDKIKNEILNSELGIIYLGYMFRIIGCNCIVFRLSSKKDFVLSTNMSYYESANTKYVCLYKVENHYDVIGVKTDGNFKVLFSEKDDIIAKIKNKLTDEFLSISDAVHSFLTDSFNDNEFIIADVMYQKGIDISYKKLESDLSKSKAKEYLTDENIERIRSSLTRDIKSIKRDLEPNNPIKDYLPK